MLKKFWDHFEEYVSVALFVVIICVTFANVVTRYLIKYSMAFSEELALYLFVWMVMLGTAIAFKKASHVSVSIFYNKFSPRWKMFFYLLSAAVSIGVFVCILYWGTLQVMEEIDLETTTEAMGLPAWYFSSALPACSVLIIIRILGRIRGDLNAIRSEAHE